MAAGVKRGIGFFCKGGTEERVCMLTRSQTLTLPKASLEDTQTTPGSKDSGELGMEVPNALSGLTAAAGMGKGQLQSWAHQDAHSSSRRLEHRYLAAPGGQEADHCRAPPSPQHGPSSTARPHPLPGSHPTFKCGI